MRRARWRAKRLCRPAPAVHRAASKQFPLPSSLQVVPGTERAQAAYPYYTQFSAADDQRFWFYNSMHFPEPMSAFERKCVHDVVNAISGVESESEGVEPSRRIVVRPVA